MDKDPRTETVLVNVKVTKGEPEIVVVNAQVTPEARAARLQAVISESEPEHWQVDVADDDPDTPDVTNLTARYVGPDEELRRYFPASK